jgi:hypothetical protein
MMRAHAITRELQLYDPCLFAKKENGMMKIFRRTKRLEWLEYEGETVGFLKEDPYFVCALTHNWTVNGVPVDWGLEPISKKIRESDLWKRDKLADELIASYEKQAEASARHTRNETEAFLGEFRSQFAKTFDGVNTANMAKIDNRRKYDGRYK